MNVRVIPHKRDKTKWAVDYYCPVTKKRKYESFDSKKEAVARKKELEGKAATGEYRPLHKRTWNEFKAEYEACVLRHKSLGTQELYHEAVVAFERLCSPSEMQRIDTRAIDEFANKRAAEQFYGRTISLHTVNKNLAHLRSMLRRGHSWGYLPRLPEFHLLSTPDPDPRAIPPQVFDAIVEATAKLAPSRKPIIQGKVFRDPPNADWWAAFLSVAYYGGLRWGEILNLHWGDVRFTSKPDLRVWNQKKSRWDHVPMSPTLVERLKAWMARAENVADDALVFPHACHVRTLHTVWTGCRSGPGSKSRFGSTT